MLIARSPNVIPFPVRHRTDPESISIAGATSEPESSPVLVEHDGRTYPLIVLITSLPIENLLQLQAAAPRFGQEAWDWVVQRWPLLAESIIDKTESAAVSR